MTARAGTRSGATVSSGEDVTEFAALLTELKARTGRSYGSLARRVGMNTSTLHRYCAGEAVPQDFAPVERLAEFCGATPGERLELHRRWLHAAASRQQRGRGAAGAWASQAPDETTTQEPTATAAQARDEAAMPGSATATTQAPDEAAPHSPNTTTTQTPDQAAPHSPNTTTTQTPDQAAPHSPNTTTTQTPDQAAAQDSTTATAQAPDEAAAHGPAAGVAHTPDEAAPQGAVAGGPASGGEEAGFRPWYRRRRGVVLLGVGCVLLATLGTLSALPGDGRPASSAPAPSSADPSSTPTTPTTAPHSSLTPTVSLTPGALAPSPGRTDTDPSAPSSAGPTSAAPASGVPLAWTADSQVWALGCDHDYVVDKPPARVPPPPAEQDAGPWATAQGAVHGRETNVEISVQGRSSTAVVLTALRVRVAGRATPAPGTVYAMDQGCGSSLSERYFAVDLDKDRPIAHPVAGNDAGTPIPAIRLPYRVSAQDPEVLLVTARTKTCDCAWYLELDWSSQGRTGTVRIDDHGRPFRTSAVEGLPRYLYDTSARAWQPYTP
ncbi:helix-turn-helix domain-containing protein [Streptomyces sp. NPDC096132]|uniref:helix-turn-helix domain-containing protein n=1 Tax=Streptomyces sp. NPDC096132 TaxID=3366075 RepID=UPI00382293D2